MRVATFLRSYGAIYVIALLVGVYSTIYELMGVAPSAVTELVIGYGAATCLAMWASLDARTRRSTPCYDFGTFVFFTWYFTVPCYLIATRGWRGALIVFTVFVTVIAAIVFVMIAATVGGIIA